jgi:hypothetical protein
LSETDVDAIRQARADGVPAGEIAARFGISVYTVYDLLSGRTWRHV